MVDAFLQLHDESVEFTTAVKGAWLRAMQGQSKDDDVKRLSALHRRMSDHLDTLKGQTKR